jgi:hypothetical protein
MSIYQSKPVDQKTHLSNLEHARLVRRLKELSLETSEGPGQLGVELRGVWQQINRVAPNDPVPEWLPLGLYIQGLGDEYATFRGLFSITFNYLGEEDSSKPKAGLDKAIELAVQWADDVENSRLTKTWLRCFLCGSFHSYLCWTVDSTAAPQWWRDKQERQTQNKRRRLDHSIYQDG